MQGTFADLIGLALTTPELARELEALAARYDLEITVDPEALTEDELEAVAGGGSVKVTMASLTGGGMPDGMVNPASSSPVPTPYPNVGPGTGDSNVTTDGDGESSGGGDTKKDVTSIGG
jgi:hypothetical protein